MAIKSRSRLTQAERETALLAAAGRSNKDIAAQLGISVRTVENHLQHVYEKLGISARTDLPEGLEHAY
jgi:DNA-binding CsgD family transcriptional regulator